MTSWKDRPELFVGNFKVNHKEDDYEPFRLAGVFKTKDDEYWVVQDAEWSYPVEDCTLIARQIEDMADEELDFCQDLWHELVYYTKGKSISAKQAIKIKCEQGDFDTIIHLLSIGVYPFSEEKECEYESP